MWLLLFCLVGGVWGTDVCGDIDGDGHLIVSVNDAEVSACPTTVASVWFNTSVTAIAANAFNGATNLELAVFPSTITSIGASAFATCVNLQYIQIPSSVQTINTSAFSHCERARYVQLNEGLTIIGQTAFQYGIYSTIVIPASVTTIEQGAFLNTNYLQILIVLGTSTSFGAQAFSGLELHSLYVHPYSTEPDSFFAVGSTYVTIEAGNTYNYWNGQNMHTDVSWLNTYNSSAICSPVTARSQFTAADVFFNQGNITITEDIPVHSIHEQFCRPYVIDLYMEAPATTVSANAMIGSTGLTSVSFASSVTVIEKDAFFQCGGLESIAFREGITSLSTNSFSETHLDTVIVPMSVSLLEANAFANISTLETVILLSREVHIHSNVFLGASIRSFWAANITNNATITICNTTQFYTGHVNIVNCTAATDNNWAATATASLAPQLSFLYSVVSTTNLPAENTTSTPSPSPPSSSSSLSTGAILGIIVGLLVIVGAVGYFLYSRQTTIDSPNANTYKFL